MSDTGSTADRALPRLTMLREITDRSVLDQVFRQGRVTRTGLADTTGISKPTISQSVRRLEEAGLLRETGMQTGRRGRVASFYQLDPLSGWVLALEINQSGIHSSAADLTGGSFDQHNRPPVRSGDTQAMINSLRGSVQRVLDLAQKEHGPLRATVLSVANPVDPQTQHIITLPHSPFPEGLVQPEVFLAPLVGNLKVENDVNLAALAERRIGAAQGASSFAYLHLGAGLGLSFGFGDQLLRGARGLAGEIGYLPLGSVGPSLSDVLIGRGFGRADAPSLDVEAVSIMITDAEGGDTVAQQRLTEFCGPVAQAIAAVYAVNDPELVLLGGPIGSQPGLLAPLHQALSKITELPARVETSQLSGSPSLQGALHLALETGRDSLVALD